MTRVLVLHCSDTQRCSLLHLPDDVLLLILMQVLNTMATFHNRKRWRTFVLVCKRMYHVGKRFPLELELSRQQVGPSPYAIVLVMSAFSFTNQLPVTLNLWSVKSSHG
jgi:hypothetical protein